MKHAITKSYIKHAYMGFLYCRDNCSSTDQCRLLSEISRFVLYKQGHDGHCTRSINHQTRYIDWLPTVCV